MCKIGNEKFIYSGEFQVVLPYYDKILPSCEFEKMIEIEMCSTAFKKLDIDVLDKYFTLDLGKNSSSWVINTFLRVFYDSAKYVIRDLGCIVEKESYYPCTNIYPFLCYVYYDSFLAEYRIICNCDSKVLCNKLNIPERVLNLKDSEDVLSVMHGMLNSFEYIPLVIDGSGGVCYGVEGSMVRSCLGRNILADKEVVEGLIFEGSVKSCNDISDDLFYFIELRKDGKYAIRIDEYTSGLDKYSV